MHVVIIQWVYGLYRLSNLFRISAYFVWITLKICQPKLHCIFGDGTNLTCFRYKYLIIKFVRVGNSICTIIKTLTFQQ